MRCGDMEYNVGVLLGELRKHETLLDSHTDKSDNMPVTHFSKLFLSKIEKYKRIAIQELWSVSRYCLGKSAFHNGALYEASSSCEIHFLCWLALYKISFLIEPRCGSDERGKLPLKTIFHMIMLIKDYGR